jgi:hypothetical protein
MLAKKLKTEKSYQFKFSGNQKQFEFNADLDYDIGRIKRAAESKDYATNIVSPMLYTRVE